MVHVTSNKEETTNKITKMVLEKRLAACVSNIE
jgi:uncharacterized protein involved in tolerance to divalent cations